MMPNAKQIQQLQARLAKIQEQLGNETVTASVSGVCWAKACGAARMVQATTTAAAPVRSLNAGC